MFEGNGAVAKPRQTQRRGRQQQLAASHKSETRTGARAARRKAQGQAAEWAKLGRHGSFGQQLAAITATAIAAAQPASGTASGGGGRWVRVPAA